MKVIARWPQVVLLSAALTLPAWSGASAQQQELPATSSQQQPQAQQQQPAFPAPPSDSASGSKVLTTVYGSPPADLSGLSEGPEVDGYISARRGHAMQVTASDGTTKTIFISDGTEIRSSKGLFGMNHEKLGADSLITGLPVSVETVQWGDGLVASKVKFKDKDLKTAAMIHNGTSQQFAMQGASIDKNTSATKENAAQAKANAAAAEALRGRFGDIDNYDIKDTTNVYFKTGRATLSPLAKSDLCNAATKADGISNALLLVVGYTDSTGSQELNQRLSEKRAAAVVNYLQQSCGWKPWRMLSPTGMAKADPAASNATAIGRAQNRRVSVNVLVSKSVEGNSSTSSSTGNTSSPGN